MPTEHEVATQLLLEAFRTYSVQWQEQPKIATALLHFFAPLNEGEFQALLEAGRISRDSRQAGVVFLRPPERESELMPLLAGVVSLKGKVPEVRIRVALYRLDKNGEPCGEGFRFETPEGPDGTSRHGFYHCQPIQSFEGRPLTSGWASTSTPAAPLDANNPIGLILCVLVSLYGLQGILALSRETQRFLKDYTDALRVVKNRPRFFRVVQGNQARFCCCRRVEAEPAVRATFPDSQVSSCSEADYAAAPENLKHYLAD